MTTLSVKDLPPNLQRMLGVGNSTTDLRRRLATSSMRSGSSTITAQRPSQAFSNAVGFARENNNCWCNSLLQMVVHIPSFRTAYETFARGNLSHLSSQADMQHARVLLHALTRYTDCLQTQRPVPSSVSQEVRVALSHFFPDSISPFSERNEDAHEALQLIMSGYQDIARQNGEALIPSLYTGVEITRTYESIGDPRAADPERLAGANPYTRLLDGMTFYDGFDYQIALDVHNQSHLDFEDLLLRCFHQENPAAESAVYLRADDQIQDFRLRRVDWQFREPPQELVILAKRFSSDPMTGQGFKICDPCDIPLSFQLPVEASLSGHQPRYDLKAFILHQGSMDSGHYITYRKVDGVWVECDDSFLTEKSEEDVIRILKNSAGSDVTSYIHYYQQRTEHPQAERLSVQAGIAPSAPPLPPAPKMKEPEASDDTALKETHLPRSMYAELQKIGDLLKWCGPDYPVIERVRPWLRVSQTMLRPGDDVPPETRHRLRKRCSENPTQVRDEMVSSLEEALKDPENPSGPFSLELFNRNAPKPVQHIIGTMVHRNSIFFSERIRCAAEMKEVGDYLRRCPDEPIARYMGHWLGHFTHLMGHSNFSELHAAIIESLENILKGSEDRRATFPPGIFSPQAEPIVSFMLTKMKNKESVFFSENLQRFLQRQALQESIDRIRGVGIQHFLQGLKAQEVDRELQAQVADLNRKGEEYRAKLAAIHQKFVADTAPIVEQVQQLGIDIPAREQEIREDLTNLRQEVAELREGNAEVKHKILTVQEAAKRVEEEQGQLKQAQAELSQAIEEAKDAQAQNLLLTGLLIGGSLILTWGMSAAATAVAGSQMAATATIAKVAGSTMITVGLSTIDPGKQAPGPRRGPSRR